MQVEKQVFRGTLVSFPHQGPKSKKEPLFPITVFMFRSVCISVVEDHLKSLLKRWPPSHHYPFYTIKNHLWATYDQTLKKVVAFASYLIFSFLFCSVLHWSPSLKFFSLFLNCFSLPPLTVTSGSIYCLRMKQELELLLCAWVHCSKADIILLIYVTVITFSLFLEYI